MHPMALEKAYNAFALPTSLEKTIPQELFAEQVEFIMLAHQLPRASARGL